MTPSAAIERTSAPRRKSCEACKSAKRRCDLALPACLRCARRNIPCIYPGRQPVRWNEMNMDFISTPSQPYTPSQDAIDFALPDLPDVGPLPLADSHLSLNDFDPISQFTYLGASTDIPLDIVKSRTRTLRPVSAIIAKRLQFAVDLLNEAPKMMVLENKTPWCHQQLYKGGMPKTMQDAYACCALYIAKNEINAPVILASFESRIQELLSSPVSTSPIETLSHTQALVLYQIMRLFDGDIRARASAESLMPVLEQSAVSLIGQIEFPDITFANSELPATIHPVMESWDSWVFQESARRTVLFSFYLIQIYKFFQGEEALQCDGRLGLIHSWYLSAHLWNAQSAFDFAVAWAEKEHFVVVNADFSGALRNAQPDDVDLFGKMLLVTVLGVDEVRAWFHSRGAIL
ncbi:hypothetical protein FE257_012167 [Aspergillus nanangensis]|uniref:Zn(2)-C6 fungal-type domain-containing protein n=1 Tax=Aspergillus nanangensis TaxID=2582783 RepID=A0AAD4GQ65_ASPNN|nr:hypothetical protein FE257_012167 [Aspergillus nanangensis]